MFDFFRSLFKPVPPSGETAKERLKLVLLSDHLSLAPDVVESLKRDLMEVISRYVEIDSAHADVTFEHREREIAMLASIPITGVRARETPKSTVFPTPPPPAPRAEPSFKNDHLVFEPRVPQAVTTPLQASAAVAQEDATAMPAVEPEATATPAAEPAATRAENAAPSDESIGAAETASPAAVESGEEALELAPKPKAKPKAVPSPGQTPVRASNAAPPRRRRRKKFAAAAAAAAAAKQASQSQQLGNQASAQG